jgi:N-acetylmuramoyl-L-alanine amidase
VIVLDPGHGGVDNGATSPQGVHEKGVVMAFAQVLQRELSKTERFKILLTRSGDYSVPLRGRYTVARRAGADLFISLHADSNPFRSARGLSVYTLSERASDKEAAALARRENRADAIAGVSLKGESNQVASILIDLAQRETMTRSGRFAGLLVAALKSEFALVDRAHRYAGFAVLKAPDVPSVLVEIGYLTNRKDARLLNSGQYRLRLAKRMVVAIETYFDGKRGPATGGK